MFAKASSLNRTPRRRITRWRKSPGRQSWDRKKKIWKIVKRIKSVGWYRDDAESELANTEGSCSECRCESAAYRLIGVHSCFYRRHRRGRDLREKEREREREKDGDRGRNLQGKRQAVCWSASLNDIARKPAETHFALLCCLRTLDRDWPMWIIRDWRCHGIFRFLRLLIFIVQWQQVTCNYPTTVNFLLLLYLLLTFLVIFLAFWLKTRIILAFHLKLSSLDR